MARVGILTGGGDCPGLNAVIRGVVRRGLMQAGDSVVRTTVFLADMNDFGAMNEVYRTFFSEPYPARSTIQAARLPRDARIEIDVIASLDV